MASGNGLHRLSGSAFFDRGYSVYAVAEETGGGTFDVRIAIQFAPNYTTNDDIAAYQLRLGNGTVVDVPAEQTQQLAPTTSFYTTAMLTAPLGALQVVPVTYKGDPYEAEAFSISPSTRNWDAPIGTLAMVRNAKSTARFNLRSAPSEAAEVWMQYYNGTPLIITNVLPNGWVAVTVGANAMDNSTRGYMKTDLLAFGYEVSQVQPAMPRYCAENNFTLYSKPDDTSEGLASCDKGTDILVLGTSTTWYHAEVNGVLGYVKISSMGSSANQGQSSTATQTKAPAQSSGSTQLQSDLKLRTYNAKRNTDYGYTIDGVVTEVSSGQFIVNVNIQLPQDLMNDVVVAYNLYVNGNLTVTANRAQQGDAAPTRFKGSFSFSGAITSLQFVPVLEKGGEKTNDSEYVHFSIK